MPLVIDASVLLDWALSEGNRIADIVKECLNTDAAVAPSLWWFEVRNGLVMAERRGRSSEAISASFLREVTRLAITIDYSPDEAVIIALARRHRLTVYDAAYLELALRERQPLATLDVSLATAARQEGVAVLGDDGP
jgi:predicted nucleic acid-binding protein